jgi:hypothetical protein
MCAAIEEQRQYFRPGVERRVHQRRRAGVVRCVDVGAGRDERPDRVDVVAANRLEQRAGRARWHVGREESRYQRDGERKTRES